MHYLHKLSIRNNQTYEEEELFYYNIFYFNNKYQ